MNSASPSFSFTDIQKENYPLRVVQKRIINKTATIPYGQADSVTRAIFSS
jgi:hypothetical protein